MRKTLGQAKLSTIAKAVGIAPCNPAFVQLLNEAQEELADAGKWWGTFRRLYVCVTGGCITWPREVAAVEGLRMCNYGVTLVNEWYDFQEEVCADYVTTCGDLTWCGPSKLSARERSPLAVDFTVDSQIRIYPANSSDAGKRVLLQGLDANGNKIRSLDGSTYVDGVWLELESPFSTTDQIFKARSLTGVQKPLTNDRLSVYAVNPDTATETLVSTWEPSERNPDYRRDYLTNRPQSGACCSGDNGCATPPTCTGNTAEAIVRLEFIPALVDTDWLFISNVTAIKEMMRSIQLRDRDMDRAGDHREAAIGLLNNELEKYVPKQQMRVNYRHNGTAGPQRVFAGMI